jgi:hypothetical protein
MAESIFDFDSLTKPLNAFFYTSGYLIDKIIGYNQIAVKCEFTCQCYKENPRNSEFYICKKKVITTKDLIDVLIENQFDPGCYHYILDVFKVNTECQVTAWFSTMF